MMLQEKDPAGFRQVMEKYRRDLVEKNKDGMSPMEAGPVTLGARLLSSRFPEGYEAISYGRGTWLFHMLRTMLKDAAAQEAGRKGRAAAARRSLRAGAAKSAAAVRREIDQHARIAGRVCGGASAGTAL